MTEELRPKDQAERVAHFRAQLIGPLLVGELPRGEFGATLRELSTRRVRPPGHKTTRTYAVPTLQRWYYAYRRGGIEALRPAPRTDRGAARALSDAQRTLVLAIKEQHPRASAELILRTLQADGRIEVGLVKPTTLRRLFAQHGLDRDSLRRRDLSGRVRRRWEASAPGVLWHADVCHGPTLTIEDHRVPLRIHAILDDVSRRVIALSVVDNEREIEMLRLLVRALRSHPGPDTLYLDNGSTYGGKTLQTACARLQIQLLHAKPYDPQARGKMERFWRTLRQGCLDFIGEVSSLHDVTVRLRAFVDEHYHRAPHASLMGKTPNEVWATHTRHECFYSEPKLAQALVVHGRRRVRADGTIRIGGVDWEAEQGYLAGRVVRIGRALLESRSAPWVEHEGKRHALKRVDPKATRKRPRVKAVGNGIDVPFDPPTTLLHKAVGRTQKAGDR